MSFARHLATLTDRVISARIIAKALIDMRGSTVKAVFEAAAQGKLEVGDWRRSELSLNPLVEELHVAGINRDTGRPFAVKSAPFRDGLVDNAAAELGAVALSQQQELAMAGVDLQIKGLSDIVSRARQGITAVRGAASSIDESAKAFVATAAEVQRQIDAAHDDLKFEATQLGNAGPASSDQSAPSQG